MRLLFWSRRHPLTGSAPAVVSLTTYGQRLRTVHLAISSACRGPARPQRVLLFVDEYERALRSRTLQRLVKRGLEIIPCENLGPHKKYYPYVEGLLEAELSAPTTPLVTIDDDVIYPARWLSELIAAHAIEPDVVIAHRCHRITRRGESLAPYAEWLSCRLEKPSYANFSTGVSGVLYPVGFLYCLKREGDAFKQQAPSADDVWLHSRAVKYGYKTRQVKATPADYPTIPGTFATSLFRANVLMGDNDRQIHACYDSDSLRRICEEV